MDKIKKSVLAPGLIALIFILLKISVYIDIDLFTSGQGAFLALILLQIMIFLLPAVLYCKLRSSNFSEKLRLNAIAPDKLPVTVLATFVLLLGTALLKLLISSLGLSQESYNLYSYTVPEGSGILSTLYVVVVFAVIPAITEEFVFRGVMQAEYEEYGILISLVVPSFLFSMLHGSITAFIVYFFAGMVLAFTAYLTKSIFATAIIHIINNVFSIFVEGYVWDIFAKRENVIFVVFVLFSLFLICLIFMFSEAERIIYNLGISNEPSPVEKLSARAWLLRLGEMMISPTYITCTVIFLLSAIGVFR